MNKSLTAPFLVALAVLLFGLGARTIENRGVARYAQMAQETVETGHWLAPTREGEVFVEKPPLLIWAIAGLYSAAGEPSELLARLPSALAAALAVLAVTLFGARTLGRNAGMLAGLLLLANHLWVLYGRMSRTDVPLAALLAAAVFSFYLGRQEDRRWAWYPWTGVALGLAVLTKGPLALVVFGLAVLPYLWLAGAWRELGRVETWAGLALAAGIPAAWFLPWWLHIPEAARRAWVQEFLWEENIARATSGYDKPEPVWYYLKHLPAQFFPGSLALAGALAAGLRRGGELRAWRSLPPLRVLLWGWALLPLAFFSVARGKDIRYALVLLPAFALLAGDAWERAMREGLLARARRRLLDGTALLMAVLAVAGPVWAWLEQPDYFTAALACGFLAAIAASGMQIARQAGPRADDARALVLAVTLGLFGVHGFVLPAANEAASPWRRLHRELGRAVSDPSLRFLDAGLLHDAAPLTLYRKRMSRPLERPWRTGDAGLYIGYARTVPYLLASRSQVVAGALYQPKRSRDGPPRDVVILRVDRTRLGSATPAPAPGPRDGRGAPASTGGESAANVLRRILDRGNLDGAASDELRRLWLDTDDAWVLETAECELARTGDAGELEALLLWLDGCGAPRPRRLRLQGRLLLARGDASGARTAWTSLLEEDSWDETAYRLLTPLLRGPGHGASWAALARRRWDALEGRPNRLDALHDVLRAHRAQGDLEEALAEWARRATEDPAFPRLLGEYAWMYAHDPEAGLLWDKLVLVRDPDNARLFHRCADHLEGVGRLAELRDLALLIAPACSNQELAEDAARRLADAVAAETDPRAWLARLRHMARARPGDAVVRYALLDLVAGEPAAAAEATALLEDLRRVFPEHQGLADRLLSALEGEGRLEQALALARELEQGADPVPRRLYEVAELRLVLKLGRTGDALRTALHWLSPEMQSTLGTEERVLRGYSLRRYGTPEQQERLAELEDAAGADVDDRLRLYAAEATLAWELNDPAHMRRALHMLAAKAPRGAWPPDVRARVQAMEAWLKGR